MTRMEKLRKVKAYLRLCRMRGKTNFSTADVIRYATGSFLGRDGGENAFFINREWECFMVSLNMTVGNIKRNGTTLCRDDRRKSVRTTLWQFA